MNVESSHTTLDNDSLYMFLVVGYRSHYCSNSPSQLNMFGLYRTTDRAKERIFDITGAECTNNITKGNHHTCWINRIYLGDFSIHPNSGGYDNYSS